MLSTTSRARNHDTLWNEVTIAKVEHDGYQFSPGELWKLKRHLAGGPVLFKRCREMMIGPAY